MASASLYKFSKRKNSTKQPTGTGTVVTLTLKSGTSFISPTFLLNNSGYPAFNYVIFEGMNYFIREIVCVRQDLWEVICEIDALATAKAAILASTQYVSYSSQAGNSWLADTRIPVLKNATVSKASTTLNFLFTDGGFYVISTIGNGDGCKTWLTDITNIKKMINDVSQWKDSTANTIKSVLPFSNPTTEIQAYQNFTEAIIETGVVGNAYLDAPNCIRSCIWVPFFASFFREGSMSNITLGAFTTSADAYECKTGPVSRTATVSIPWQYSDWRRTVCEEVYLYLPLVGMVSIPSDEIVNETSLTIEWSATATDGCIAYRVLAGNQVVGTFGANCSVNYPIGISQQASAGEIVQSYLAGAEKITSAAVHSSITPTQAPAAIASIAATTAVSAYDTMNVKMSRHNSCIGGIGGGAGTGLSLDAECFTVAHPTIVTPSDMQATMGLPTMKPMSLSSLTGYCQCANAHVELDLPSSVMDIVDSFINSGFYIE